MRQVIWMIRTGKDDAIESVVSDAPEFLSEWVCNYLISNKKYGGKHE